jgi:hypothetical protein
VSAEVEFFSIDFSVLVRKGDYQAPVRLKVLALIWLILKKFGNYRKINEIVVRAGVGVLVYLSKYFM